MAKGIKTGGRKIGTTNKITNDLREVISDVLQDEMTPAKLKTILKEIEPEKRLIYLIKLTDYVLPRLQSIASPESERDTKITIEYV